MKQQTDKKHVNYKNIIDATISLISENGIKNVSAAKVATSVGISKSNVFHYFNSVDKLLLATLEEIMLLLVGAIDNDMPNNIEEVFLSLETTLFARDEKTAMVERAFWAFYCESIFNSDYREIFSKYLDGAIKDLTMLFSKVKGVENAEDLSRQIIAMLDGMCIHISITGNREEYLQAWHLFKKQIISKSRE